MTYRERDYQRAKLYRAENDQGVFLGARFRTIAEIEKYLNRVFSHQWFKRHYPRVRRFKVSDGRGTRCAHGWLDGRTAVLSLPSWARTELVILHELAHAATQSNWGHGTAAHGWEFCSTFLALVQHYQGAVAGRALKASFRKHRARFHAKKRCRKMTPEEREEAIIRLAAARAKIGKGD